MALYSLFHLLNPLKALCRKSGIRRFPEPELQKGLSKARGARYAGLKNKGEQKNTAPGIFANASKSNRVTKK